MRLLFMSLLGALYTIRFDFKVPKSHLDNPAQWKIMPILYI